MSYAIQDYGRCAMLVPGFRIVFCPVLVIVDEIDLAIVAHFIGETAIAHPYAELTSITDQGETT